MQNTVRDFFQTLIEGVQPLDKKNLSIHITFISIPVLVLLLLNLGSSRTFSFIFGNLHVVKGFSSNQFMFWAQAYMTGCTFLFLMIFPVILFTISPVKMEYAYGMRIRGTARHFSVSLLVIAVMIPVLWFSFSMSNLNKFYPIYKPISMSDWILYECIYLPLFIPTEFFFRGVVLYRLEKFFPGRGVWIAFIAYAIGHIYKPLPEALVSIIAGYVLGMLSLQCRSIWPGVVIHAGIALLADIFAMIQSGYIHKLI